MGEYSFSNKKVEEWFHCFVLPTMQHDAYCGFSTFNPNNLSEEDVAEIREALKAELGRDYKVEKGWKYVHISPDGHNEYDRRRRVARKKFGVKDAEWPTDWYDQCGAPVSMYTVEFHGAHVVGIGPIIRSKLPSENLESYTSGLKERGYVRVNDKTERLAFRAPVDADKKDFFRRIIIVPFV